LKENNLDNGAMSIEKVEKHIESIKGMSSYQQQMKKSIERKTMAPLMKGYSNATNRARSINDAVPKDEHAKDETILEIQRKMSSPKPAPKAEERNPQH
jgi:hypothetical protein